VHTIERLRKTGKLVKYLIIGWDGYCKTILCLRMEF